MSTTLAAALGQWVAYRHKLKELGLVAASTVANQSAIAAGLEAALGDIALADLRKSHIELHIGERLQSCAPVTVQGELNVLRQVLNWCVDEQLLATKPRLPTVKVPAREDALPSDTAFLWVLANLPEKHALALEFMMLTGLAPHELERVQPRDVQVYFGLRIGHRPDFAVKQASRRRDIPLNKRAHVLWFEAAYGLRADARVFPTVSAMDKAITRLRMTARFAQAPAGVDAITPKMMRKWFASKLSTEEEGKPAVPEHVLQRLLGHAPGSPITRKHYVRSSDEQLVGATAGLRA